MKNLVLFTFLFVVFIGCKKEENLPAPYVPVNEDSEGYNLLLIGNSFFRPYAEKLDVLAINKAGFLNTTVQELLGEEIMDVQLIFGMIH